VFVGYGAILAIMRYGNLLPLGRVLFVPGVTHNLISIRMLGIHGFTTRFTDDKARVEEWTTLSTIITANIAKGDHYRLKW